MSQRIDELFADYASHHQTRGNKLCHRFGIPMIMFSLIGLLQIFVVAQHPIRIDVAMLLIAAAVLAYLRWSAPLAMAMLPVAIAMYLIALLLPSWLHGALFVLGWILQFIGHSKYEKQRPAFLKNLVHLLVGPLWILNDVLPLRRAPQSVP